jgi:hypothetical protein
VDNKFDIDVVWLLFYLIKMFMFMIILIMMYYIYKVT